MIRNSLVAFLAALGAVAASAAPFNLANYHVTGNFALDRLGDMGWEASAVAYARDRGTLFFVGDEGLGVVEISRTGQTISTMAFSGGTNLGWPTTSTNRDAEGLTYVGNGVLVVAEERLQDAFRFNYVAGGSVNLANAQAVSIGSGNVGNNGIEGISYDPRDGSFVSVKQQNPQNVLGGTLDFTLGTSTMAPLIVDPTVLGLATLSDVQTLSPVDGLSAAQADNLLILSLGSNRLLEVTRAGAIVSSLDLTGISPNNAIEGITIDENGVIYLVAEHEQSPETEDSRSRLIVLTAVPAPGTLALMFAGLGVLGWRARRRH